MNKTLKWLMGIKELKPNLQGILDEGFTETGMGFGYTSKIFERKGTDNRIIYDERTDDVFRYKYELGGRNK